MIDLQSYIVQRLEEAKSQILANMERADQIVTGKTRDSLQVEMDSDNEGRLVGRRFFHTLETGSFPNKRVQEPPPAMVTSIQEWLIARGLKYDAYATAKKILKQGSWLYRNGGRIDIFTPVVENFDETFSDGLEECYEAEIHTILENFIRQTKDK